MMIRAYMRASTDKQDATRARDELKLFISKNNNRIASYYSENISGTTATRPELERLIADSERGDVLLVEKMDRLTRLPYEQWQTLKGRINAAGIIIVCVDLSMTHHILSSAKDNVLSGMQLVLTDFMLEIGANMARDDYETRVKRQKQGIVKAKELGKYKGKQPNTKLYMKIVELLDVGLSYSKIQNTLDCSPTTIKRAKDWNVKMLDRYK